MKVRGLALFAVRVQAALARQFCDESMMALKTQARYGQHLQCAHTKSCNVVALAGGHDCDVLTLLNLNAHASDESNHSVASVWRDRHCEMLVRQLMHPIKHNVVFNKQNATWAVQKTL